MKKVSIYRPVAEHVLGVLDSLQRAYRQAAGLTDSSQDDSYTIRAHNASVSLREALAEPEPEVCTACESNPSDDNNPCVICGMSAPTPRKPEQEPVIVEAVGTVERGLEGEPEVYWLVEGGLHAIAEGGTVTLLIADKEITDEYGYGEVFTAPAPTPRKPEQDDCNYRDELIKAEREIEKLRERLARVEQPVAWRTQNANPPGGYVLFQQYPQGLVDLGRAIEPLYTSAPTPRKPVELSEQEIWDAVQQGVVGGIGFPSKAVAVARSVIAAYEAKQGGQT